MARAKRKQDDFENGTGTNVVPIATKQDREEIKAKVKTAVERLDDANGMIEEARTNKSVVMKELIAQGLDRNILNKIVKLRKKGASEMENEAELTKLYAEAVGLQLAFDF